MEVVALCDVHKPTLAKANARLDGKPATYGDFRKLIDRKDLDAVVIATPDHWHAIQTIDACDAGKDVYVEKPLSITIHEGPADGRGGPAQQAGRAGRHPPPLARRCTPSWPS